MKRPRRRGLILILLVAAAVGCAAGGATTVAGAAGDVRLLASELERIHPNPYHEVSREDFRRQVDELAACAESLERDELVVGLMRLMGLLGERDGHSGIYTLHAHPRPLRLYPLRVYWFSDGLTLVDGDGLAGERGSKLVAIERVPIDDVVAKVRPLITRDNEWSRRERIPYYLVCAEVLHGLGIGTGGKATFTFESVRGRRDVELEPVSAGQYADRFPFFWQPPAPPAGAPTPLWVRHRSKPQAVATMQRGRFVYVAYNSTYDSADLAARLVRLARKPSFRRVILDLRQNGGGNNSKYAPLLNALTNRFVVRRSRPVVLTGRTTFSAAGNFVADIERFTRARLVGEPPGGSPNQWGDFAPVVLPNVGLEVMVATTYVQSGRPDDVRAAIEPHVRVELSTADWLAGRDPALASALSIR
jgi:hypothetical protein